MDETQSSWKAFKKKDQKTTTFRQKIADETQSSGRSRPRIKATSHRSSWELRSLGPEDSLKPSTSSQLSGFMGLRWKVECFGLRVLSNQEMRSCLRVFGAWGFGLLFRGVGFWFFFQWFVGLGFRVRGFQFGRSLGFWVGL